MCVPTMCSEHQSCGQLLDTLGRLRWQLSRCTSWRTCTRLHDFHGEASPKPSDLHWLLEQAELTKARKSRIELHERMINVVTAHNSAKHGLDERKRAMKEHRKWVRS